MTLYSCNSKEEGRGERVANSESCRVEQQDTLLRRDFFARTQPDVESGSLDAENLKGQLHQKQYHHKLKQQHPYQQLATSSNRMTTTSIRNNNNKTEQQYNNNNNKRAKLRRIARRTMQLFLAMLILDLIVYYWPMEEPEIETKVADYRPRPKFVGPLAVNRLLDSSELLFHNQFHAPESMAWRADKRAFYTGVEGGFILLVEPSELRWTLVARLNARNQVRDLSAGVRFLTSDGSSVEMYSNASNSNSSTVPFCTSDTELYGDQAEFLPKLVVLSRCSRPLGIRLSPDETKLYVSDPLSGLYLIELGQSNSSIAQADTRVSKLVDLTAYQTPSALTERGKSDESRVSFADDIAIEWGAGESGGDLIYLTDCSRRWTVRYLLRVILENDDSGRVLVFDTSRKTLSQLQLGPTINAKNESIDLRRLSFPNGVELSSNKSALLINDLNNRRVLMHHLRGPFAGQTHHLFWVPGYPDNVRRGLDTADGRATYWLACGCAVSDSSSFEVQEFSNSYPKVRKLFLKYFHFIGSHLQTLGAILSSTYLQDVGFQVKAIWLKRDPYCTHGLVVQFDEEGEILRSLHAPSFSSNFKLLSEAHQVPALDSTGSSNKTSNYSYLYFGSVYYSYLGRLSLFD